MILKIYFKQEIKNKEVQNQEKEATMTQYRGQFDAIHAHVSEMNSQVRFFLDIQ